MFTEIATHFIEIAISLMIVTAIVIAGIVILGIIFSKFF